MAGLRVSVRHNGNHHQQRRRDGPPHPSRMCIPADDSMRYTYTLYFSNEYFRLCGLNSKKRTRLPAIVNSFSFEGSKTNSVVFGGRSTVLPCGGWVTVPETFPHRSTCPATLDWPDLLIVVSVE